MNARTEIYHRPELDEIKPVVEKLRSDPKAWDAYKKEQRVRLRAINDVRPITPGLTYRS